MDARAEQALRRVDVAHADHRFAREQVGLDRERTSARVTKQVLRATLAVEGLGERLHAELAERRAVEHRTVAGRMPQHEPEASRIVEAQHAIAEHEVDVIVDAHRRVDRHHAQRAGHAEVDQQRADEIGRVGRPAVDQNELSAAADGLDEGPGNGRGQCVRHALAQAGVAHDDRIDASSDDAGLDAAARDFDFRQFRHRRGFGLDSCRIPGRYRQRW